MRLGASRLADGNFRRQSPHMAKEDPERARRLAEALRDNLRRRKQQDRARQDVPADDDAIASHRDDARPRD